MAICSPNDLAVLLAFPGMEINERDNDGNTALYWAVANRATQAVEFLVVEGMDLDVRNNKGQTA
jgi:ankyrin repeat protein